MKPDHKNRTLRTYDDQAVLNRAILTWTRERERLYEVLDGCEDGFLRTGDILHAIAGCNRTLAYLERERQRNTDTLPAHGLVEPVPTQGDSA